MRKIILLDEDTISKIAAGEVVERPSSIVKELMENSLDAGARNITVEIKNGGKSYIRITDDGQGINNEDLDLAFKRHSTSKLESIEDLYRIRTLGFRGEALASISQVAKLEVISKTKDDLGGIHGIVEDGEVKSREVIGCPVGTTMIIKDLFYNLPVRKEFLRSDLVEANHISDIIYKTAIGNPDTSFKFIKDNRVVLKTSSNNNMRSHIYSVLGKEFSNNMLPINYEENNIKIGGYISNNNLYRSNRNHQYLYINGRYISNVNISNLIEENYKSLIPINRYPCFIVFLDIEPGVIDVNIHPSKQEVKFSNQIEVFEAISKACKEALYSSLIVPKMEIGGRRDTPREKPLPLLYDLPKNRAEDSKDDGYIQRDIVVKDFTIEDTPILARRQEPQVNVGQKELEREDHKEKEDIKDILSNIRPISILFKTYILALDELGEKLYFVDQHAAHERVMYERYLEEYKKEEIVIQQLLVAEIVSVTNKEMDIFLDNIDLFEKLGFDLAEFGNNEIAIRGVPIVFGEPKLKELFFEILDNIEGISSSYDTKLDKIMKIACTNSVKGGDNLEDIEIMALFDKLKVTENPHTCPHGRPILLEMTKRDVERAFLRIN